MQELQNIIPRRGEILSAALQVNYNTQINNLHYTNVPNTN